MLIEWNSPRPIEETDDPSSDLLLQRFVRQVASRGEAVAVVLDHESATQVLSYGALAAASRRLASSLRSLGVAPEERVALASERCGEMVIGLLAILQAGATFLPIDPKTPAERLRFMLADSKARVLLTLERHLENLGVGSRTSVVCLDGVRPSSVSPSSVSPSSVSPSGGLPGGASPADPRLHNELPALPTADRAAYVIYTSGSTGRPKGVEVSHGALSHVLAYRAATTATTDAKLQRTTLSFDVAIAEIFLPLVTGGRTVLAPPGAETDGDALARLIRRQRITLAAFPPSLLAPLTRGGRIAECPSLRTVGVGGEAVPVDLPARFYAQSEAELINRYGPTEAAIFMLDWRCRRETEPSLPIGRPVGANRVALVDPDLRPTPLEAAGELAIAGPSLARGYLDRPAMTAAAFIPDPTPQGSGGRLYKTGDLARFRVDGALEFLGRIDQQIKIRGFRVELGEIEAVLAEHPAVDESAVIARHDGPSQRLVAYVAARSTGEEEAEEEVTAALQGHLHARVPDYMIPPVFVFLQALPRSASGKLDRQALPAPARRSAAHQSTAPRNATEAALADIWRQVLRLEALGVEDNFFALGGDSILCLQVVNRARQAGFELTPRQVFDHPTLAELAAVTQQASAEPEPQPAAEPLGTVPLTPIQRWFFDQDFAEPWHWNQSLLLRPRRRLDRARIDQALDRLVHRHDALRLRFEPSDEGWRQHRIAARDATLSSCEIDFTALAEVDRTVAATAAANALQASLDLTAGPIGRIALLRQEADDDRLFWLLHHLVVDAVSWRVLLADFEDAYRRPESATPSPRSTPFAGWAAGLADLTTAPELAAELDFWQSQPFARVEPLAIDEPAVPERSDTLEADAATVTTWLDAGHLEALLRQAPGTYRLRVEELLLIALVATLADHSSTRTVALELEGHGRDLASLAPDLDLSATVGWFTALYPVVLRVPQACGEPETSERGVPPRRLIREVKEQLRRIPSHGIGFGLLASTA
ncbi:MAG: amino acid adenylation domain-containing protein, partial [Acidobacteriota bacterium]